MTDPITKNFLQHKELYQTVFNNACHPHNVGIPIQLKIVDKVEAATYFEKLLALLEVPVSLVRHEEAKSLRTNCRKGITKAKNALDQELNKEFPPGPQYKPIHQHVTLIQTYTIFSKIVRLCLLCKVAAFQRKR